MTLRKTVFLRTYSLLAALTVAICATMSVSLVMHHRNTQKQDGKLTTLFIAKNAAKFILWDDRIGLKSLLDEAIQSNPTIEYAFVEVGNRPYVHTMQGGVPKGLLGLHGDPKGAAVVEVQNRKGEVIYDVGASAADADAIVRLGLSLAAIDAQSRGVLLGILAICLTMLALSVFLAAWVASRVTREVHGMNSALLLDESRMAALLHLNQMTSASIPEITTFALEEAVRLTESTIGYLAFLNEDESVMTMHAWSKTAMHECAIVDKPIVYRVAETGLWGEAVRQRKPVITNDYAAPNPLKKGHPEGHVAVVRHMNVPVFDGDRIVVVAGVGNKKDGYNESDVRQLTLLMQGLWQMIQRREAADELRKAHDELEVRVRERTSELQTSEFYYREIINSAADAIFVHDMPSGDIIDCNRRACEALGYSREEMLRLSVHHIDASFSQELDIAELAKLKPGMSATLLRFHRRKDQSVFPVEVNIVAITRNGRSMVVAVARDITERKRAEEAMRESEAWYKTLFVEAVDGICLADAKTGLIVDCNQALTEMVGRDKAELIGKPQAILHPPTGDNKPFSSTFRQHLDDRAGKILDTQVVSKTGEVRDVAIKATVVNLAGRTVMHGLFRDVTERKRVEEGMRTSKAMLSCILNSQPLSIFWKDRKSVYLGCNETFARGAKLRPEDVIGKTDFDLPWSREDAEAYRADDQKVMTSGQAKMHIIERQHHPDGSCIWLDTTKVPLFDADGKIYGVMGIYDDITARKQMEDDLHKAKEAAEAANLAKSAFLANMSHEIRTPMTAILGYADLMLDENVGRDTREHVAVIKSNGEHLLKVIGDILDLSKIEAGKLQIEPTRCSPVQLVAEVVLLMRPQAAAKQLMLKTELLQPLPETVLTDPLRLRQVLVNLVGNAIKFTGQGEVCLAVRLDTDGSRASLCFDVTDTGIGMNEEQVGKLFQPFSQVDDSSTRKFGGTGLGLCISKHLAEALGGDIQVRSEPGKGSTFSVTIDPGPLDGMHMVEDAQETAAEPPPTVQPADADKIALHGRVLVAEDMMENRRLIALLLRNAGAQVSAVENGQIAIEAVLAACEAGEPFDVILMDMQMPVLDGYEATRQLRKRGYTGSIVALTAHAMAEDRQKCLDVGCNDYASKPIDRHKLLATVARWTVCDRTHTAVPVSRS